MSPPALELSVCRCGKFATVLNKEDRLPNGDTEEIKLMTHFQDTPYIRVTKTIVIIVIYVSIVFLEKILKNTKRY